MDEQEFKLYELYLRIQTLESSVAAVFALLAQQHSDSAAAVAVALGTIQDSTAITLAHLQDLDFSADQIQRLQAAALGIQDSYEAMLAQTATDSV